MKLIRLPEVCNLTGLSRSSLYRAIKSRDFPGAVRLGERSVAWRLEDIEKWIDKRPDLPPLFNPTSA